MEVHCVLCKLGTGFPKGSIIGLVLFITYLHDLPLRINSVSQPILFADNGSVIISGSVKFNYMIKWFAANMLVLNLDKTK